MIFKKTKKRGFSLVEVLLALAVGGLVLLAASSLLMTISTAWANRPATRDAFDAHIDGVYRFLTALIEDVSLPMDAKSGDQLISLDTPKGYDDSDDPLISFFVREAPPLLFSPFGPIVNASIYFYPEAEDSRLSLLWYSSLQELERNEQGVVELAEEDELRKTLISPFLGEVFFGYYGEESDGNSNNEDDFKEWEWTEKLKESETKEGEYRLPDQMKLVFEWEDENLEKTITIAIKKPAPSGIVASPR